LGDVESALSSVQQTNGYTVRALVGDIIAVHTSEQSGWAFVRVPIAHLPLPDFGNQVNSPVIVVPKLVATQHTQVSALRQESGVIYS
jgi:hypothetical protein